LNSPEQDSTSKIVIIAPSYAGKSTAHRAGIALDPEETEDYREWKEGWDDPKRRDSPEWREAQGVAYTEHTIRALDGDAPVVLMHPWDTETDKSTGYPNLLSDRGITDVRLVLIPYVELQRRTKEDAKHNGKTKMQNTLSRYHAALKGHSKMFWMKIRDSHLPVYDSIEEAVDGSNPIY